MATVHEVERFGKCLGFLDNRIKVINQMLGYGVVGNNDNPIRMKIYRGCYYIYIDDCELCSFGIWDNDGASLACERVEGLNDGLWYLLGRSRLRVPKNATV